MEAPPPQAGSASARRVQKELLNIWLMIFPRHLPDTHTLNLGSFSLSLFLLLLPFFSLSLSLCVSLTHTHTRLSITHTHTHTHYMAFIIWSGK